ncbi:MAG: YfcC family protein, partial [Lentimicrobiaceae bacterium]|nr:YfcC family protein [Lentimicrobiaceae bacterium]
MVKQKKFPHTYVIVFFVIVFAGVLTWVIPGGAFERETILVDGVQREVVSSDSFHYIGNS